MDATDEYLMGQVVRGEAVHLEPLVRRHAAPLLTFLTRMLGDHHHAEELFQEVFLTVWVKRRQYQYPRPFRPWLYTIALNRCRAVRRLKTPRPLPLLDEGPTAELAPESGLLAAEASQQINEAITTLPEQQRAVVVLRVWHEMSYATIAETVGCSEVTARSHMHHALAALRSRPHKLIPGERT
jgi:RNA polymerase sigma-70 factor (ECF subfamily)